MFHYPQKRQKGSEPAAVSVRNGLRWLIDYFISAYIVFIAVVLPFYTEHGYRYIATEKSLFFRKGSMYIGTALIPLLLLYLVFSLICCRAGREKDGTREKTVISEKAVIREKVGVREKAGEKRDTGEKEKSWGKLRGFWRLIRHKLTMTDRFALLYGLALTISWFCSDYREDARWGAAGWYMGFYTQLILLSIYFLVSRLWKPRKGFFYLMLGASGVVFVLGILNRFSIYPVKWELANPGFISTIGNINWYCGYAVTVFFAGAALLWQDAGKRTWQRALLTVYAGIGFAALVTQGSASGIVTLAVVMLVMFALAAKEGKRMVRFWSLALLLWAACLLAAVWRGLVPEMLNYQDTLMDLLTEGILPIIMTVASFFALLWMKQAVKKNRYPQKKVECTAKSVVTIVSVLLIAFILVITINTLYPGSIGALSQYSIFTFSGKWGSNRGETWRAGVLCFSEQNILHKLVGVGPDAMEAYLYQDGNKALAERLQDAFGVYFLANAHNEWLTVLVNTGILGLAGFAGMMVSAMRTFMKSLWKNPLVGACGFSLLAYTVNNIFSFQQVMNVTTAYVILGMGMAFSAEEKLKTA